MELLIMIAALLIVSHALMFWCGWLFRKQGEQLRILHARFRGRHIGWVTGRNLGLLEGIAECEKTHVRKAANGRFMKRS